MNELITYAQGVTLTVATYTALAITINYGLAYGMFFYALTRAR